MILEKVQIIKGQPGVQFPFLLGFISCNYKQFNLICIVSEMRWNSGEMKSKVNDKKWQ